MLFGAAARVKRTPVEGNRLSGAKEAWLEGFAILPSLRQLERGVKSTEIRCKMLTTECKFSSTKVLPTKPKWHRKSHRVLFFCYNI